MSDLPRVGSYRKATGSIRGKVPSERHDRGAVRLSRIPAGEGLPEPLPLLVLLVLVLLAARHRDQGALAV